VEETPFDAAYRAAPRWLAHSRRRRAPLADPAIAAAEIASEYRRGADYVRVTVALAVSAADELAISWDAFRDAARDDFTGREVTAATSAVSDRLPHTSLP
jgi:hypothetical protein